MSTSPLPTSELRHHYQAESVRLESDFLSTKDGLDYVRRRASLVDSVLRRLWSQVVSFSELDQKQILLAAVSDLGREILFPYSEANLLMLAETSDGARKFAAATGQLQQAAAEVGLKCAFNSGVVSEFLQFDSDRADEVLSLLDIRFLAGSQGMFGNFRSRLIPEVMRREAQVLVERLAEVARASHRRFANTVFHLEPNVRDAPGGLQDYVTARWLAALSVMESSGSWSESDTLFAQEIRPAMQSALAFLASVRCFLQFRNKRDFNLLTWDAQDDAAARGIGRENRAASAPADWMRVYFAHARAVEHISSQ